MARMSRSAPLSTRLPTKQPFTQRVSTIASIPATQAAHLVAQPLAVQPSIEQIAAQEGLLPAEVLQKSAQETFAAGKFGGPRTLAADEPILVDRASSTNNSAAAVSPLFAPIKTFTPPAFASLFATPSHPANASPHLVSSAITPSAVPLISAPVIERSQNNPAAAPRRRWRTSQNSSHSASAHHNVSQVDNVIADASIYTDTTPGESGHSRKRVLTDR